MKMAQTGIKRIILDVDAGVDDAYAILAFIYAENSGKIKIDAITLSQGNASLANVCKNVVRVLEIVGRTDIPIYKGASEALITSDTPYIFNHFGEDGFGDIPYENSPNIDIIQTKPAVLAINDIVMQNPGEVSLVCVAPLTNIALTIKLFNNFIGNVKEIFILGGNYKGIGNTPTSAEFNFYLDPEAAHITLSNAKCPVTIIPYETVVKCGMDINWRFKELASIKSPIMKLLNEVETKVHSRNIFKAGIWYPFDCYLAMAVIYPSEIILKCQEYHVTVELNGTETRGQMVLHRINTRTPNVNIIKKINIEMLKKTIYESISALHL